MISSLSMEQRKNVKQQDFSLRSFIKRTREEVTIYQDEDIIVIANNVFLRVKQIIQKRIQSSLFEDLVGLYIELMRSKENNQHYEATLERHLKELLGENFIKYKHHKNIYYFISQIFKFWSYLAYKILQTRIDILDTRIKEAIQIYEIFIQFAAHKKHRSLLHKYLHTQLDSANPCIVRIIVILKHYKQTIHQNTLQLLLNTIDNIITNQSYETDTESHYQLLRLIQVTMQQNWPQNFSAKNACILKYAHIWKKSTDPTTCQLINLIISHLTIDDDVIEELRFLITEKMVQIGPNEDEAVSKFKFINTIIKKLGKNKTEDIVNIESFTKFIKIITSENLLLSEELVDLLSTLTELNVYNMQHEIQDKLLTKIKITLLQQERPKKINTSLIKDKSNVKIFYKKTSEISFSIQQTEQKCVKGYLLAIRALRIFCFRQEFLWNIYSLIKYILKRQLPGGSNMQFNKEVIKVCFYVIEREEGGAGSKDIMKDILKIIGQDIQLKLMLIDWISYSQHFYCKHIFQILQAPESLAMLYQDYGSNNIMLKRWSVKILCFLYPLKQCEIVPFLKKVYFQLFDRLSGQGSISNSEKKMALKLIREIIRHRTEIILNSAEQFCEFLFKELAEEIRSHIENKSIIIELLKTFMWLVRKLPQHGYPYARPITHFLIKLINSKETHRDLKKHIFDILNEIVRSCGYVLLPYFHFKNLFNILREILVVDNYSEYQIQLLRLLGALGYISREKYWRMLKLTEKADEFESLQIQVQFSKVFRQINHISVLKNTKLRLQLQPLVSKSPFFTKEKTTRTYMGILNFKQYVLTKVVNNISDTSSKTVLFSTFKVLRLLVPIIPTDHEAFFHRIVIQKIMGIQQKFPIIQEFHLILSILTHQNINANVDIFYSYVLTNMYFLNKNQPTSKDQKDECGCLIQICQLLSRCSGCRNSDEIKQMVIWLRKVVRQERINQEKIISVLMIFNNLSDQVDEHLHLFLPDFNRLFLRKPNTICEPYLQLLLKISQLAPSFYYFLPSIKQYIYDILQTQVNNDPNHSLIHKIIQFLVLLMVVHGQRLRNTIHKFHALISQLQVKNIFYRIAEDYMKKNATLNNLRNAFTNAELRQLFHPYQLVFQKEKPQLIKYGEPITPMMIDHMIKQFNCEKYQIQEESEEWFNKLSILMFQKSQQPFIQACSQVVKEDKILSYDLVSLAVYFFWQVLSEEHKQQFSFQLKAILKSKVLSLKVKQKFIDIIYFMQQCETPIVEELKLLCEVSEEVLDLAKSLFYMEKLFEQNPYTYGQSLINMYGKMGETQSAVGLLRVMPNLNIRAKIVLYQKLNRHLQALKEYQMLQQKLKFDNMLLQIQIRKQMSEWDAVFNLCASQTAKNPTKKSKLAHLAVQASINLGKWDQVRGWLPSLEQKNQHTNLWKTMLHIHEKKYNEAEKFIREDRKNIYPKISQLFNFSYERSMEGIIHLQQLCELEETAQFLKLEKDTIRQQIEQNEKEENIKKQKYHLMQKKRRIGILWNDRIQGLNKNLSAMQQILLSRNLLFSKSEDVMNWIDYCRLALRQNQPELCKKTLNVLNEQLSNNKRKFQIQTLLLETKFILGQINDQEAVLMVEKLIEEKGGTSLHKLYYNCALWLSEKQFDFTLEKGNKSIQMLRKSIINFPKYIKGWHMMGLMHLKILQLQEEEKKRHKTDRKIIKEEEMDTSLHLNKDNKVNRGQHIEQALHCFIESVGCGVKNHQFFLEDCLKIMNIIFSQQESGTLLDALKTVTNIPADGLIQIIPQIIGRLDVHDKPKLLQVMKKFLIHIGCNHPQALVFPLIFLRKGKNEVRKRIATDIYREICKKEGNQLQVIYQQAQVIADQLCKVSLKLNQRFNIFIKKIQTSKGNQIVKAQKYKKIISKLLMNSAHELSTSQFGFIQQYKQDLRQILLNLTMFLETYEPEFFKTAEKIILEIVSENGANLKLLKKIQLESVSLVLKSIRNSKVSLFGCYNPTKDCIYISGFQNELQVINSKQRPKKLIITGSNQKDYNYLLKGKEDLRLDERIMQLFSLINKMFHDPTEAETYSIMGYSITPISLETGIIQWVENCDTIGELIEKHRKPKLFLEKEVCREICQQYNSLPKAHKVEIFKERFTQHILDKINQQLGVAKNLAVMSIVGFIIGLGDRHPHNIMIQRDTGRIVHIDFGDCFDVNKMRKQYPQKVPFRLTRMLVKAMEPCGTHGIFKHTCEKIIKLLRNNKESIIAIAQAFRYDPLIGWRLIEKDDETMLEHSFEENTQESFMEQDKKKTDIKSVNRAQFSFSEHILNEIKKKLNGKENDDSSKIMTPEEQVNNLIREAISPENLVQHYEGWCIYW